MSKFQVGDIVIVNNKTLMSYGCICRVIEPEYRNPLNSHLVYVSIVSMGENTRLKELPYHAACMQFKEGNLKHYNYENETEVTPMNTINSNEKFTLVKIRFLEGSNRDREYCYASYEESIGCGDFVVCKSANHGFGIAEVTEIVTTNHYSENELESMRNFALAGREIVSRFNMSRYEKRVMDRERIRKCNTERKKSLQLLYKCPKKR